MPSPASVALLALAYRDLATPADSTRGLSLLGAMAAEPLNNATDDAIFEAIEQPAALLAALPELAAVAPVRAEALLHGYCDEATLAEAWAAPFRAHWDEVEQAMTVLQLLGAATSPREMEALAGVSVDA